MRGVERFRPPREPGVAAPRCLAARARYLARMALHIIKLVVGCDTIEDLLEWHKDKSQPWVMHTRMTPKRIEAARKLLASGMSAREIAPTIGVSVATLYRHLPAPEQEAINAEEMERDGAAGASTIKPTE